MDLYSTFLDTSNVLVTLVQTKPDIYYENCIQSTRKQKKKKVQKGAKC